MQTITPNHVKRWPLPWASAAPAPLLGLQLLRKSRIVAMDMRYTTSVRIEQETAFDVALKNATALTKTEVAQIMVNPRASANALLAGHGTRMQWACICTALNMSRAIEDGGVVRGLAAHLDDIERALNAIGKRAGDSATPPTWMAPALWSAEREAVRLLITLHAQQLASLSYLEYQTAWRLAVSRVQSSGGEVTSTNELNGDEA